MPSLASRVALVVSVALLLLAAPAAAAPPAGGVLLVDRPASPLLDGANVSFFDAGGRTMSEDGRYVVFASAADALHPDTFSQVFRRDLTTADTVLVSTGPDGPANGLCGSPSLSADGTKVAFRCGDTGNLVTGVSGNAVYVRDVGAGTTEVVSRGDGANGPVATSALSPVISGDGTAVAFVTTDALPANGGTTDVNGATDIYVRDGTATFLASVPVGSTTAGGGFGIPGIDFDGTAVAFLTQAALAHDNAAFTDSGSSIDAYLRERTGAHTYLISHGAATQAGASQGAPPAVSGNGNQVAWNTSTAVIAADDNGVLDVYTTTVSTDARTLISRRSAADGGAVGDGSSGSPAYPIGPSAVYIAFQTAAQNFGGDGNGPTRDIAVRSIGANTTTLATGTAGGGTAPDDNTAAPAVSGDGSRVSFVSLATNLGGPRDFQNVFTRAGTQTARLTAVGQRAVRGQRPDRRRRAPRTQRRRPLRGVQVEVGRALRPGRRPLLERLPARHGDRRVCAREHRRGRRPRK